MALQDCHECKKKVSTEAVACPNCGAPVIIQPETENPGCLKSIFVTLLILTTIYVVIIADHPQSSVTPKQLSEEMKLYNKVKNIPASQWKKNRDLYSELMILNPKKKLYKTKYDYYSKQIEGKKSRENNSANKSELSPALQTNLGKADISSTKQNQDKYSDRIDPSGLSPYTTKGYPKTVQKYKTRLKEVEHFRRRVAEMVLDSGKCKFIEYVELSTKSMLNNLIFYTDCRNGQRVYLNEREITKGEKVLTQADKSWGEEAARQSCIDAIKSSAMLPSELDIHHFTGTSVYKAPTTHNVVVTINFDAKNLLGAEIPHTATCHFEPGKVGTVDIQIRRQ
jgi:DNA-directed RNA polymerase subunit RPC12/RpoP